MMLGQSVAPKTRFTLVVMSCVLSLVMGACGGSTTAEPTSAATVPPIAGMSLQPAAEAPTPQPIDIEDPLPSIAVPTGSPVAPTPGDDPGYNAGADDLTVFAATYRAAFPGLELNDEDLDAIGARLCTYLSRHADASGVVDAADVLTQADLSEPGYARSDWVIAFELAMEHYCGEFSGDFATAEGGLR